CDSLCHLHAVVSLPPSLRPLLLLSARHPLPLLFSLFFFHDPPPTHIYTLSLHDALPISGSRTAPATASRSPPRTAPTCGIRPNGDRKSTRLNSSHVSISYAVFCLKKKKRDCSGVVWIAIRIAAAQGSIRRQHTKYPASTQ